MLYSQLQLHQEDEPLEMLRLEEQHHKKLKVFTIDYEYEPRAIESLKRMVLVNE